jgi:Protein of unknown function (DUF3102)
MNKQMTVQSEGRKVARPLKILIPMIQSELQQGNSAGHEHYTRAGEMLIEAKGQVAYGTWGQWLTKNFDLSRSTAAVYMQWARAHEDALSRGARQPSFNSLRDMRGDTERQREQRQSKQQQDFRRVLRDVAADTFVQERQARDEEIKLHRELAEELVEIGYRALALKLHPDRGGAKIAMSRLNCIHDDLKRYVQTRRFGG